MRRGGIVVEKQVIVVEAVLLRLRGEPGRKQTVIVVLSSPVSVAHTLVILCFDSAKIGRWWCQAGHQVLLHGADFATRSQMSGCIRQQVQVAYWRSGG